MTRVSNFNAGPAGLPTSVLERAKSELVDFQGTGMSIMEHSHRGKAYDAVHQAALGGIREVLGVPDDYYVMFLQGGASLQFAMLPMNLLPEGKSADYILTGVWSEKAIEEAKVIGQTRVAGSTKGDKYTRIPKQSELDLSADAVYAHVTTNNTIFGTQWNAEPDVGKVPLIADMSSDFMSRKIDVKKYGVIYAGAQKNVGPSGVVVVIARKEIVDNASKKLPQILQYRTFASSDSLHNTPPTFAIYLVKLVMDWVREVGGLGALEKRNEEKARNLYGTLDKHAGFYDAPVAKDSRSRMNVVWRLPNEELEKQFLSGADKAGLVGLKGHRSVGGCRASIYNAVSPEDVQKLCDYVDDFAKKHG